MVAAFLCARLPFRRQDAGGTLNAYKSGVKAQQTVETLEGSNRSQMGARRFDPSGVDKGPTTTNPTDTASRAFVEKTRE